MLSFRGYLGKIESASQNAWTRMYTVVPDQRLKYTDTQVLAVVYEIRLLEPFHPFFWLAQVILVRYINEILDLGADMSYVLLFFILEI